MATNRRRRPALALAHERVVLRFASVMRCQRLWFRELLVPYGVTPRQYVILREIRERDGQTLKALASRMFVDATALSRTLSRMEDAGLIERRRSATDRRESHVWLTAEGRALVMRLQPALEAARRRLFDGIDAHGLKQLEATLDTMLANIAAAGNVDVPLYHSDLEDA